MKIKAFFGKIKKFFSELKNKRKEPKKKTQKTPFIKEKKVKKESDKQNYFERAKTWADEIFTNAEVSKNRWFFAFTVMSAISVLLLIVIVLMMPLKTTQLAMVHERNDGTWDYVTIHNQKEILQDWNQTKADIARYINVREGYEPHNIVSDNEFIKILSNRLVYQQYIDEQEAPESFLNTIADKGYAKVKMVSIARLSEKNDTGLLKKINQAIVVFDVTIYTAKKTKTYRYTANIGWDYIEPENKSQEVLLNNPFGFTVTNFQITKFE